MPVTSENQLTIEKTPHYFITPNVPELVYKFNPNIKLILVIRDPTTRAISHYTHHLSNLNIKYSAFSKTLNNSFEKGVLENFDEVKEKAWIKHGVYINYLKNWLKYFRMEQFVFDDKKGF